MSDDVLIRGLSAEDGWDCALTVLDDFYSMIPLTRRGRAVRDLIRIEQQRREAFHRRGPVDPVAVPPDPQETK